MLARNRVNDLEHCMIMSFTLHYMSGEYCGNFHVCQVNLLSKPRISGWLLGAMYQAFARGKR